MMVEDMLGFGIGLINHLISLILIMSFYNSRDGWFIFNKFLSYHKNQGVYPSINI